MSFPSSICHSMFHVTSPITESRHQITAHNKLLHVMSRRIVLHHKASWSRHLALLTSSHDMLRKITWHHIPSRKVTQDISHKVTLLLFTWECHITPQNVTSDHVTTLDTMTQVSTQQYVLRLAVRYTTPQQIIYTSHYMIREYILTNSLDIFWPEPPFGLAKDAPAKSCLDILIRNNSIGTGTYWIDPANTGTPIHAFCDMSTDGGRSTCLFKLKCVQ